jgi:hypothetical protein
MTKIEVVIYEDDKPIGKWVGFANRPQAVRAVVIDTHKDTQSKNLIRRVRTLRRRVRRIRPN